MNAPPRRMLAGLATVAAALLVPALAQAATVTVDPDQRCYREQQRVVLLGAGLTPNTQVGFSRDGEPLPADDPITADAAGGFSATLTLPELFSGQSMLSYVATDSANPLILAELSLLVTATEVTITPINGPPDRLLRIAARGFFGSGTRLWAHVVRSGAGRARNLSIGRVKGACKKVSARARLFAADAPPGRYAVQFDTFRRYRERRQVQSRFNVTISESSRAAAASVRLSPAS